MKKILIIACLLVCSTINYASDKKSIVLGSADNTTENLLAKDRTTSTATRGSVAGASAPLLNQQKKSWRCRLGCCRCSRCCKPRKRVAPAALGAVAVAVGGAFSNGAAGDALHEDGLARVTQAAAAQRDIDPQEAARIAGRFVRRASRAAGGEGVHMTSVESTDSEGHECDDAQHAQRGVPSHLNTLGSNRSNSKNGSGCQTPTTAERVHGATTTTAAATTTTTTFSDASAGRAYGAASVVGAGAAGHMHSHESQRGRDAAILGVSDAYASTSGTNGVNGAAHMQSHQSTQSAPAGDVRVTLVTTVPLDATHSAAE